MRNSRLLDRRVAAADHAQHLAAEEVPVAHRAVRGALPRVLRLAGHAELGGRPARRQEDRRRAVALAGLRGHGEQAVGLALDARHAVGDQLRAELERVRRHLLGQLEAVDRLEAGVVLDQLGVEELAAGHPLLEHHGAQHRAAGVEGAGEPRRARADDDQIQFSHESFARSSIAGTGPPASTQRRSPCTKRAVSTGKSGGTGPVVHINPPTKFGV